MGRYNLGYHETHGYLSYFTVDFDSKGNVYSLQYNWTDDRDEALWLSESDVKVVDEYSPYTITFVDTDKKDN